MKVTINGLEQEIVRDDHALDDLLVPLFERWIASTDDERRHWAYLVAPPGTGKSTLAHLLQLRLPQLQCLGIDGFHHTAEFLATNEHVVPDGGSEPLAAIKGAPETFDAEGLDQRITASLDGDVGWPVYDRKLHDVRPDVERVSSRHVLLEGNWLLLDDPRWSPLRRHAELVVFLTAPEELLAERLVNRKVQGGLDAEAARVFHQRSDGPNVRRVLHGSRLDGVDLILHMDSDGFLHESDKS